MKSIVPFFGQIHKYKKIFNNFSSQNKEFLPPKSTTKNSFEWDGYTTHLTKAKSGTLSVFTKNTQI